MEMRQLFSGENGSDPEEKDSCPLMLPTFLLSALKIISEKFTSKIH